MFEWLVINHSACEVIELTAPKQRAFMLPENGTQRAHISQTIFELIKFWHKVYRFHVKELKYSFGVM